MGFGESKPAPAPPKVLPKYWRDMSWGQKGTELEYLRSYRLENDAVSHLRILLYGPVGSGKSSFINSVISAIQGRMTSPALANSTSGDSFTVKYKTHKIQREHTRGFYPFVFNDVMGLEEQANRGVSEEDIKLAMQGHVKEGYRFSSAFALSEGKPDYNREPTPDDKVHALVCVVPATHVSLLSYRIMDRMRNIRLAATDLEIPQVVIFTKIDEACSVVQRDIKHVYKSKYIKEKADEFSQRLGVPVNCIFPVKNYHEEMDLNDEVDLLILRALRQIIDLANDHVNDMWPQHLKLCDS